MKECFYMKEGVAYDKILECTSKTLVIQPTNI